MTEAKALTADMFTEADRERFWRHVDRPDDRIRTCWTWTGSLNYAGYGQVFIRGRYLRAHRVAHALHYGRTPAEMVVRHACDNPRCVRPYHLGIGTHADNVQDRELAGRSARGEAVANAVLTLEQVNSARRRVRGGETIAEVAEDMGVGNAALDHAVTGKNWAHAEEPPVLTKPRKHLHRGYTTEERAAILDQARAMMAEGSSAAAAARVLGVRPNTLGKWLQDAEGPNPCRRRSAEERAEKLDRARAMMAAGSSVRAAGGEVGVSVRTLYRWLKRYPAEPVTEPVPVPA